MKEIREAIKLEDVPIEVFEPLMNTNYWDSANERSIDFLTNKLKKRKFIKTENGLIEFTESSPSIPYGGFDDHVLVFSTK